MEASCWMGKQLQSSDSSGGGASGFVSGLGFRVCRKTHGRLVEKP